MTIPTKPGRAFSGMSEAAASRLAVGMAKLTDVGLAGLSLVGAWRGRRFVIETMRAVYENVVGPTHDLDDPALTLPIRCTAETIRRECRRFGGRVERACRDRSQGTFDRVKSSVDEKTHIVHAHHHVALCSHRGPWSDSPPDPTDDEDCPRCRGISATKPAHRARYHPLTKQP